MLTSPRYDHIDAKHHMAKRHGTQAGDPPKAARAMWDVANMQDPPLRVALGSDAYDVVMEKIKEYQEIYPRYEEFSKSTDVDNST